MFSSFVFCLNAFLVACVALKLGAYDINQENGDNELEAASEAQEIVATDLCSSRMIWRNYTLVFLIPLFPPTMLDNDPCLRIHSGLELCL